MKKNFKALFCLIIFIAFSFISFGCSITEEEREKQYETQFTKTFSKIGDRVVKGDYALTVHKTRTSTGGRWNKPDSGNIFLIIDATVENLGNEKKSVGSFFDFKLEDSESKRYDSSVLSSVIKNRLSGDLMPGRKLRGEVGFEVPQNAKGFTFIFSPFLEDTIIEIKLDR